LRYADRKGGNQIANIEKMTEAEPIVSSIPPKISHFPDEFFNNIGRELSVPILQLTPRQPVISRASPLPRMMTLEGAAQADCASGENV
jgi:hypothetical protein